MSLQSVIHFFETNAPDIRVLEMPTSTATVAEAAAVHGVEPGQIAKTLSLWLKDEVIILVMAGDTRLDNTKFKAEFNAKARMLNAEEVLAWTGHPVGGVCPFGLPHPLRIFVDVSLRRFKEVLPAAGDIHAAARIDPERLGALVNAQWVDIAKPADGSSSA